MYILSILAGLTLIFFFSFSIGLLLEKIRIPGIIAPLLVGVVFKIIPFFSFLKQKGTFGCFDFLASLGVMFLLFFIGLEIDLPQMRRLSKVIIWLTVLNTLFPFLFGIGVGLLFGYSLLISFIIGLTRMPTAEAVVVPILDEFGVIKSKIGQLIVGAGTLDDIVEVFLVAFVSVIIGHKEMSASPTFILFGLGIFLITTFILAKIILPLLHHLLIKPHLWQYLMFALFGLFCLSFVAERFDLGLVIGAVVAGIILQPYLAQNTKTGMSAFTTVRAIAYGFLGPIFFFWVGYTTDLTTIFCFPLLTLALFLAAFLGKMLGVYLLTFNQTLTKKEAIAIGIGLNARLTTELIVAQLLFAAHLIDEVLFTALVAASAFSTLSVPLLTSFILDKWKEELR